MLNSRVTIFTGGYGSGKTEIAVNYAMHLNKSREKVAIVDLDIVNPYFRSREARDILEREGVRLIAPKGSLSSADLPALPSEIYGVLRDDTVNVVLDVGGDDVGARALGRFAKHIPDDAEMLFVLNPARPFQSTPEKATEIARKIESVSRRSIGAVICNANLVYDTTISYIEDTYPIAERTANILNVPIAFTAVNKELIKTEGAPKVPSGLFELTLHMSPEWRF